MLVYVINGNITYAKFFSLTVANATIASIDVLLMFLCYVADIPNIATLLAML